MYTREVTEISYLINVNEHSMIDSICLFHTEDLECVL